MLPNVIEKWNTLKYILHTLIRLKIFIHFLVILLLIIEYQSSFFIENLDKA